MDNIQSSYLLSPNQQSSQQFLFAEDDSNMMASSRRQKMQKQLSQENYNEMIKVMNRKSNIRESFEDFEDHSNEYEERVLEQKEVNCDLLSLTEKNNQEKSLSIQSNESNQEKQRQNGQLLKISINSNDKSGNNSTDDKIDKINGMQKQQQQQQQQQQQSQQMSDSILLKPRNSDEISQLPLISHRKSVYNAPGFIQSNQSGSISQIQQSQQQPRGRSTSRVLDMGLQFQLQPQKKRYTLTRAIGLATKVQRFVRLITQLIAGKQGLKKLTPKQISVINDRSYFTEEEIKYMQLKEKNSYSQNRSLRDDQQQFNEKQFNRSKQKLSQALKNYQPQVEPLTVQVKKYVKMMWKRIPIIKPNSRLKILLDIYQSFLVIYRMFVTTVKLSFFTTEIASSVNLISQNWLILINASFILDMLITFKTGFYKKGNIIEDETQIIKNYVQNGLKSDLVAQIPLVIAYFVNSDSPYAIVLISFLLEFLIFAKWFSLKNVMNRIEKVVTENEKYSAYWPLAELIVNLLLIAHVFGLVYHGLAVVELSADPAATTWIQLNDFDNDNWLPKYIHSIYWALCTMVTIQLYTPPTDAETFFTLLSFFILTGVFGYMINTIGMILEDISKKENNIKQERERVGRFFRKRNLNRQLRERVTSYLEYIQSQELEKNAEEEKMILDRLSEQLRKEILQEINRPNLEKFQQLKLDGNGYKFSDTTLNETLLIINEHTYSPGDVIYQSQDHESAGINLYYIDKGTVQIYYQRGESREIKVTTLSQGSNFGQYEFFTGEARIVSAKAYESCSLLMINRAQFIKILKSNLNTSDYELFKMIGDLQYQFIHDERFEKLPFVDCYLCDSKDHMAHDCEKCHYIANKKKIIHDYNNFDINIRARFDRTEYKTPKCLTILEELKDGVDDVFDWEDDIKKAAMELRKMYEENIPPDELEENKENKDKSTFAKRASWLENNLLNRQRRSIDMLRRQSMESEMDEQEEEAMNKRAQQRRERMGNAALQQQQILLMQQKIKEKEKDTENIQEENEEDEDKKKEEVADDTQSARVPKLNPKLIDESQIPEIFKRADRRKRTIGVINPQQQQTQQANPAPFQSQRRGSMIGGLLPGGRGSILGQTQNEDENAPEEFLDENYMQGKKTYRRQSMVGNHQILSAGLLQQIGEKYLNNPIQKNFEEPKNHQQELIDQKLKQQMSNARIEEAQIWDFKSFDRMKIFHVYLIHNNMNKLVEEHVYSEHFSEEDKRRDMFQNRMQRNSVFNKAKPVLQRNNSVYSRMSLKNENEANQNEDKTPARRNSNSALLNVNNILVNKRLSIQTQNFEQLSNFHSQQQKMNPGMRQGSLTLHGQTQGGGGNSPLLKESENSSNNKFSKSMRFIENDGDQNDLQLNGEDKGNEDQKEDRIIKQYGVLDLEENQKIIQEKSNLLIAKYKQRPSIREARGESFMSAYPGAEIFLEDQNSNEEQQAPDDAQNQQIPSRGRFDSAIKSSSNNPEDQPPEESKKRSASVTGFQGENRKRNKSIKGRDRLQSGISMTSLAIKEEEQSDESQKDVDEKQGESSKKISQKSSQNIFQSPISLNKPMEFQNQDSMKVSHDGKQSSVSENPISIRVMEDFTPQHRDLRKNDPNESDLDQIATFGYNLENKHERSESDERIANFNSEKQWATQKDSEFGLRSPKLSKDQWDFLQIEPNPVDDQFLQLNIESSQNALGHDQNNSALSSEQSQD